ncbi:hypothetical protein BDV95DRAFT_500778 [Massariosphaeria phaeospora]|uniref:GYF domain-containing protein n=1 Tax=Massariosphaeria phaeospora TaxID=100035 RepID=A0A7C8I1Q2_9PLEO|nr:hypothetical protein BDV95DRAFT_500778 [Massariosphaeria phaeospora]
MSSSKFPAGRPKRAGDHFARTHLDGNGSSSKKPRFDPRFPSTLAPDADGDEVDPTLEADVIGKGSGVKRGAINVDGYDSDSSTENFKTRRSKKKAAGAKEENGDEDEEDMFAEEIKDDEPVKKEVKFMDDADMEGYLDQFVDETEDLGTPYKADSVDSYDSSSDSAPDEERARLDPYLDEEIGAGGKKKRAPKMDAFNMKAEQEEGRFDESGNFVRRAHDPDADQDAWLEGISKKDIKKAKEAHDKLEAARKQHERAEDAIVTADVLSTIIGYLKVGETPLEALARYGKAIPPKKRTGNKAKQAEAMEELGPAKLAAAAKAKEAIDAITESASRLTNRGIDNAYDLERERYQREFKRETGEDWTDPNPPVVEYWEFRWLTAKEDDVNGPYDKAKMQAWESSNQFEAGAEFRRVGDTEWSEYLYFDDD